MLDTTTVQYGNNGIHLSDIPTTKHIGKRYMESIAKDVVSGVNHWALHGLVHPRMDAINAVTEIVKDTRAGYARGTAGYMTRDQLYRHMLALQWEYNAQESGMEPAVLSMAENMTREDLKYYPILNRTVRDKQTPPIDMVKIRNLAGSVPLPIRQQVVNTVIKTISHPAGAIVDKPTDPDKTTHPDNTTPNHLQCIFHSIMSMVRGDEQTQFEERIRSFLTGQQIYDLRQCETTPLVRSTELENGVWFFASTAMFMLLLQLLYTYTSRTKTQPNQNIDNATCATNTELVVDLRRYIKDTVANQPMLASFDRSAYAHCIENHSIIMEAARFDQLGPVDGPTGEAMYAEILRLRGLTLALEKTTEEKICDRFEENLLVGLDTVYSKFSRKMIGDGSVRGID